MQAKRLGKTLNSRELNDLVHPLRRSDNVTNLGYLIADYLTLAAILSAAVTFLVCRSSWGLHWGWSIPVLILSAFLVGGIQHRLAGFGHEASHYSLFKNRLANELVSDLFCMFPIFTTTHQYRWIHMGHHQYTNDWSRDPDLINSGHRKRMDRFPMTRRQFIMTYYVKHFWPPVLMKYLWDILATSLRLKTTEAIVSSDNETEVVAFSMNFRGLGLWAVAYFLLLGASLAFANARQDGMALFATAAVGWGVAMAAIAFLPERMFFHSPLKPVYSARISSGLRVTYYSALLVFFAGMRYATGHNWGAYALLLWMAPFCLTFPYYLMLRDVYQHAHADDGKLTNSRVFFADPFTRWAVFGHGGEMHVPHHLFPVVPHYNLAELHRVLAENNREYAENVVECHGTFSNRIHRPTILDVMEAGTFETSPYGKTTVEFSRQSPPSAQAM